MFLLKHNSVQFVYRDNFGLNESNPPFLSQMKMSPVIVTVKMSGVCTSWNRSLNRLLQFLSVAYEVNIAFSVSHDIADEKHLLLSATSMCKFFVSYLSY
jgi:hypothetical protein